MRGRGRTIRSLSAEVSNLPLFKYLLTVGAALFLGLLALSAVLEPGSDKAVVARATTKVSALAPIAQPSRSRTVAFEVRCRSVRRVAEQG
jgi:hypothetical protein